MVAPHIKRRSQRNLRGPAQPVKVAKIVEAVKEVVAPKTKAPKKKVSKKVSVKKD